MKDRQLVLSSEVDEWSVGRLIKQIRDINCIDDDKELKEVGYVREPICLIINSYGGSVRDGFGLIAAIESSKTPVHTYCFGSALSMGLPIFLSGKKRFAHYLSTFMYHQISNWNQGMLEEQKRRVKEAERLQSNYDNYILKKSRIMKDKLDEVNQKLEDWFFGTDDAIKLGVVDELVEVY